MNRSHIVLLIVVSSFLLWSGIRPLDYFTWFLEILPALLGLVALALTYRRFRFTTFAYTAMAGHAIILIIGGHYTYAEMPVFNWLRDIGLFDRNNYDKVGHFAQGFFPAVVTREVLLRLSPINGSRWLSFLVVSICLAFSALYEILEWWVSVVSGSAGDAFLGTQSYVWDTQSDMLLCLIGSAVALVVLRRAHDRALGSLWQGKRS
jgi:putative membrane protein